MWSNRIKARNVRDFTGDNYSYADQFLLVSVNEFSDEAARATLLRSSRNRSEHLRFEQVFRYLFSHYVN